MANTPDSKPEQFQGTVNTDGFVVLPFKTQSPGRNGGRSGIKQDTEKYLDESRAGYDPKTGEAPAGENVDGVTPLKGN